MRKTWSVSQTKLESWRCQSMKRSTPLLKNCNIWYWKKSSDIVNTESSLLSIMSPIDERLTLQNKKTRPRRAIILWVFYLSLLKYFKNFLVVLTIVSCKTRNHPQTLQTTQKPPKPSTNNPKTSQTTHKPPTNHPKIASFFPWRHFLWFGINSGPKNRNNCHPTKYDPFTHPAWEEKWVHLL